MIYKWCLLFVLLLFASIEYAHAQFGINKKVQTQQPQDVSLVDVEAAVAEVGEEQLALTNKLFPMVSKLFKRQQLGLPVGKVFKAVTDIVDEREMALFATIGWGLVPATEKVYGLYANVTGRGILEEGEDDEEAGDDDKANKYKLGGLFMKGTEVEGVKQKSKMKPFKSTGLYQIVDHIGQASKIAFSVVIVDVAALIGRMLGYNPGSIMSNVSRIFSKVTYSGWFVLRLSLLKKYLLGTYISRAEGSDLGRWNAADKFGNGLLYLIWFFHVLNYFEVQTGIAVKSLFSVGATGTLIFGLASKDIATELLSGITLHLSDSIYEGDSIRFGDGRSGTVDKMGWLETMIRNSDELVVGIPNTELSRQRVYNLSRTPRSQVKQELRVSYNDAHKLTEFLATIKEEIEKDCPKLITDGSRPFRAHWRTYESDHLSVVVDCHFLIKPSGSEYWDNRQVVLEAINRAAKVTEVKIGK